MTAGTSTTLGELVTRAAERWGDVEFVVGERDRVTYRDLEQRSRRLGRTLLGMGVGKGSRMGLLMGEGATWVVSWAALVRIGAIVVPISSFAKGDELARAVRHPDLHGIIVGPDPPDVDLIEKLQSALVLDATTAPILVLDYAPYLRWIGAVDRPIERPWLTELGVDLAPAVDDATFAAAELEVHPDEPAMITYTSGSTSEPKGAVHSQAGIVTKAHHLAERLAFAPGDRTCAALPWFWVGGPTMTVLPSLTVGATVVVMQRFSPERLLALIEEHRLTRIVIWPHQIPEVLAHPSLARTDLSSVTDAPPGLRGSVTPSDPDRLLPSLGMTETFGMYGWGRMTGGIQWGVPIDEVQPGLELRVLTPDGIPAGDGETGEIWLRGPGVMTGYYKRRRDETFDADGFFPTGDLVTRDGDSYRFARRTSSMIKRRGANVAPGEVEALLVGADGVAAAFVVGLDADDGDTRVGAAVVAESGVTIDADALRAWARTKISSFKVPDVIVVVDDDDLPWTPSRKMRLPELAELVQRVATEGPAAR